MRLASEENLWIERQATKRSPTLRLFCFPYAGGGASIYRDWASRLGSDVEVCAIQLPGRERRMSEPALSHLDQAVQRLVEALLPHCDRPFAMFGHSMGALLAYEVTRGLATAGRPEPIALFVSGHRAPHLPSRRRPIHSLARDAFIAEIKALDGTPPEVFDEEELVDLLVPTLRNDFELVETYVKPQGPMLSCPVFALGGRDDPNVPPQDLAGWATVTTGGFETMLFDGDHFYLRGGKTVLLRVLRAEIESRVAGPMTGAHSRRR